MLDKAAAAAMDPVTRIKEKISGKDVVNLDKTGLSPAGYLHWLHCACSGPWRFYTVHKKRGEEGMPGNDLAFFSSIASKTLAHICAISDNLCHRISCASRPLHVRLILNLFKLPPLLLQFI